MKNSINQIKNALVSIENRADYMEERISKLKGRNLEMIQVKEEKELRSKMRKFFENYLTLL